jgi:predicted nucleic acid-binding Zn ribbon protein
VKRIGEDVRRELGRFPGAAGMAAIVAAWPAAVGDAVARNAWPAKLARDGTLHVSTSSSAWAFELTQLRGEVLPRLQRAVAGEAVVTSLRFAPGRLPAVAAKAPLDAPAAGPGVDPEALAEAERVAAGVGDETLRNLLQRAAAASLAKARGDRPFC